MEKIIKDLQEIKKEFDEFAIEHIIDRYEKEKEDAKDIFEEYEAANYEEETAFDVGYSKGIQFVIKFLADKQKEQG